MATAIQESIPSVMDTDPRTCSAELTSQHADNKGYRINIVEFNLNEIDEARIQDGSYNSMPCIVVNESKGTLLGATFVREDVAALLRSAI